MAAGDWRRGTGLPEGAHTSDNNLQILTALEQLHIEECDPSLTHIGEMAALRELKLRDVTVQNLPDLIRLTTLHSLITDADGESGKELINELEYLSAGFGELGLLKDLTPDLIGLTALGSLMIEYGGKLRELRGISASWGR